MKGSHRIIIANASVRYDFTIRRNITVIKGDSATGKTTLVEMVRDYYEAGENSGISLRCDRPCRVIGGRDWKTLLDQTRDSIVFIDEDNSFLPSDAFASAARESDNYFVLVTREGLPNLPYSVDEIYGIRASGRYMSLRPVYNEFYHIYDSAAPVLPVEPRTVIVEDSGAGYEFFSEIPKKSDCAVLSAEGKSNVYAEAAAHAGQQNVLVIADGAAFGAEMDRMMKLAQRQKNLTVYLPESFEWIILRSGILREKELEAILDHPEDYIESSAHFSWERYFTALLTEMTRNGHLQYSKRKLNPHYLNAGIVAAMMDVMEGITL